MGCEILTFNEVKKKIQIFFSVLLSVRTRIFLGSRREKIFGIFIYFCFRQIAKFCSKQLHFALPDSHQRNSSDKTQNPTTACIAFFGNKQATFISVSHI